jgi:pimeloyl-ACP methyl ester carboxylesterase
MPNDTHVTAPTHRAEAKGINFAYRRFGRAEGVPLVFLQHYRGGLDHWDPLITDGFAQSRPVILFDNAGVAGSSGETPSTIDAMADHAFDFTEALGLDKVDLLGFSMGGYVAQALALRHPDHVRRLILVGTGPRAGEPAKDPRVIEVARKPINTVEDFLFMFFGHSSAGETAGRAFWARRHLRTIDVDPPSSEQTMKAQSSSFVEWSKTRGGRFSELKSISQPTLIADGVNDIMIPTINSFLLSQHIPKAQLIIYPNAGHAAHFQYPDLFLKHAELFFDSWS